MCSVHIISGTYCLVTSRVVEDVIYPPCFCQDGTKDQQVASNVEPVMQLHQ